MSGKTAKACSCRPFGSILGDYAKTAAIETFTETKFDRHPTELARLHNARLVSASETEAGRHWAESRLKMLTGGDTVPARFMHKDEFEYRPTFKLFFSGNHKPGLRSVGVAMRRRVNMIPFAFIIPEAERDPHFADKLKPEWPGILAWMIEGCLVWQAEGLKPPKAVVAATDEYFEAQNSFSFWLDECCERDPNARTPTTTLFGSWKAWAEKAGIRFGDIKTFGEALVENGFDKKHTERGNVYLGVRIAQDPPPKGDDLPFEGGLKMAETTEKQVGDRPVEDGKPVKLRTPKGAPTCGRSTFECGSSRNDFSMGSER